MRMVMVGFAVAEHKKQEVVSTKYLLTTPTENDLAKGRRKEIPLVFLRNNFFVCYNT